MSWLFSQALVAAFSADTSSDGEQSAQLNVMPTPHRFWRNDKMIAPSNLSLFGLTCAVLTETHGAELLTWFLAGFHAPTYHQPAEVKESTEHKADSGVKWLELLAKYDHDSCSWKTAQYSLLGDLIEFSGTWPRFGTMRNGACYPLPIVVPRMSGNEFGFWPTPTTDAADRETKYAQGGMPLSMAAKSWQTPRAGDADKRGDFDATNVRNGVAGEAKARATPRASDGSKGGPNSRDGSGSLHLTSMAVQWGTPTSRDHKDTGDCSNVPVNGLLGRMAKSWSGTTEKPGSLNPEFHQWLQGWPSGWTALEPLETGKYRLWRQRHGACWADHEASNDEP